MRLSEWRSSAPHRDAANPKVAAVVDPVLTSLGAGPDPHCWVAWGDEPAVRYAIFVATDPGLIVMFVRPSVPGEGPRATTKLVRWNRVAIGEMSVETQGGHRMISWQVEGQILRGADEEADRVAAFGLRVIAAIDGRPLPPVEETTGRGTGRGAGTKTAAKGSGRGASASPARARTRSASTAMTTAGPKRSGSTSGASGSSR
jgi:hypothetical protein